MSNIKKNFIYNVTYQILILIIPIVTSPYISRVLGAEKLGIYSYTYSVVYYFMLFAMLGLNNYGNRQIAKVKDNQEELNRNFCSIYALQLSSSIIMIIIYIVYLILGLSSNNDIALIQIIYLITTAFDINWFFFGMEKFKLTVTRNTIIKVITCLSVFIFVRQKDDLYIYTIIMSLGTLISQLLLWPFLKKYVKFQKVTFKKDIKKHFRPCLILFIPVIAVSLYKIMDKIMLGNMTNMTQVGLYENAEKITNILSGIITALGVVMLPRMSNLIAKGEIEKGKQYIEKSIIFTMFMSSALSFGIMSISNRFVVCFFGEEFSGAGIILQFLAITTIFISVANVIRTQYIIPMERDKSYIISVSLGAIVNIIFNLILIPKYQAVGAAVGTVIAEFSVMMYQIMDVRKGIDIFKYLKMGTKYIIIGLAMYIIVTNLKIDFDNYLIILILQVGIGAIFYLCTSMVCEMIHYKEFNIKKLLKKLL